MIEILRLSHRIARDKRISTHLGLTARTFGIQAIYYAGQKDNQLEQSLEKMNANFGSFSRFIYVKNPLALVKEKKQQGYFIIHLTMYGLSLGNELSNIKKQKKILFVVGSEHVPSKYYHEADLNLAVTNQPHSELSAIAIILYELTKGKSIEYKNAKLKIQPSERGKIIYSSS